MQHDPRKKHIVGGKEIIPVSECIELIETAQAAINDAKYVEFDRGYGDIRFIKSVLRYCENWGGITPKQRPYLSKTVSKYKGIAGLNEQFESSGLKIEYLEIVDCLSKEAEESGNMDKSGEAIGCELGHVKAFRTIFERGDTYIHENFFAPNSAISHLAISLESSTVSKIKELDKKCKEICESIRGEQI